MVQHNIGEVLGMQQPGVEAPAPDGVDPPKDHRLEFAPAAHPRSVAQTGTDANVPTMHPGRSPIPPNSGEQQVVPDPPPSCGDGQQDALTHPPLEPQKSQEACCLTDDDDTTRADGGEEMDVDGQEDEDEGEEGCDDPTPKTMGGSLYDAGSYDSIVMDKRRGPAAMELLGNTASGKKRRAIRDGERAELFNPRIKIYTY